MNDYEKYYKNPHFLDEGCFENCINLYFAVIPAGFTHICKKAFSNCKNLETVSIPYTVADVDEKAFMGCTNLKNIKFTD